MSSTILQASRRPHLAPPTVDAGGWSPVSPHDMRHTDDDAVLVAGRLTQSLPPAVYAALADFAERPHPAGALLVRNVGVGHIPATPPTPTSPTGKDSTSEFALLTIARMMGHPVGYLPEHGGEIVQNLVPVASTADRQVSTSSTSDLMFHTEAAFHPHRPRYLLLACLRGDTAAVTTLASVREVLPLLPEAVAEVLFEARYRTAVDESYLHGRSNRLGDPVPVLSGTFDEPSMVFDEDLMVGLDPAAADALRLLGSAVREHHTGVVLEAGDVLVVDNALAVHGRSPFVARYDGTDRWLQRSLVVSDLAASAGDRIGRVITTVFGD